MLKFLSFLLCAQEKSAHFIIVKFLKISFGWLKLLNALCLKTLTYKQQFNTQRQAKVKQMQKIKQMLSNTLRIIQDTFSLGNKFF